MARVIEVDALSLAGCINLNGVGEVGSETELKEEVGTKDAVINDIDMEFEDTVTNQDAVDAGEFFKAVFHSLDGGHHLTVVDHEEGVVLECLGQDCHIRVVAQGLELFRVCLHELAFHRHHLQLWVEGGEKSCHHVLKTVEDGKDAYQRSRGNGHTADRHAGDDVDGVVRLLGEKIAGCDAEGEIQRVKFKEVNGLLLKEPVDVVNIVERVVKEELELGNDTELVTLQFAQFETNL